MSNEQKKERQKANIRRRASGPYEIWQGKGGRTKITKYKDLFSLMIDGISKLEDSSKNLKDLEFNMTIKRKYKFSEKEKQDFEKLKKHHLYE